MTKRQNIRVKVFGAEQYSDGVDWPPGNLDDFISWFSAKREQIPKEYRDDATVELSSSVNYDVGYIEILIEYVRPETNEEIQARIDKAKAKDRQNEARERNLFEKLKHKYGEPS